MRKNTGIRLPILVLSLLLASGAVLGGLCLRSVLAGRESEAVSSFEASDAPEQLAGAAVSRGSRSASSAPVLHFASIQSRTAQGNPSSASTMNLPANANVSPEQAAMSQPLSQAALAIPNSEFGSIAEAPGMQKAMGLSNYFDLTLSTLKLAEETWRRQGRSPTEAQETVLFSRYGTSRKEYLAYRSANPKDVQRQLEENPQLLADISALSASIREIIRNRESP